MKPQKRPSFAKDLRGIPTHARRWTSFRRPWWKLFKRPFEAKTDWKNFHPRKRDTSFEYGKVIGPIDRYIQLWVEGTMPNQNGIRAWLSLGLFWKPARRPSAPVVAVSYAWTEKGVPLSLVDLPGRNPHVLLGPLSKRSERRLFLEPGDEFDPGETFGLLLDAADEALGAPQ
jgi:hypothetical protein